MSKKTGTITVRDSMGEMEVPETAYFGASTQRAILNFPVSGYPMPAEIVRALVLIKRAAAETNEALGLLPEELASAIKGAASEILDGKLADQFPVDIFQTGSGTSTNMNANEVIAARANELLGHGRMERKPVHPNDHVNLCQSSNDVIPASLHIASRISAEQELLPSLERLKKALEAKGEEFRDLIKIGRTHWQDAVPVTLGQEFGAYASQVEKHMARVRDSLEGLLELPLGGTAVGTGLNCHPRFASMAVSIIAETTKVPFRVAANNFAELGSKDAMTDLSKSLSGLASSLFKVASDIRFMASGPRCGIGEINLPSLQPGSSIMPGKVNPVLPESVLQVAARVIGNDVTVTMANSSGNLELNVMMPLIGHSVMESVRLLANVSSLFSSRCVSGITANAGRCEELIEMSLAMVTPLALKIGYDAAAAVAKEAYESGKSVRQVLVERGLLGQEEVDAVLDPRKMV
ncbi:MAG: aspartate ammonia-lyase [Deltaproteobacteria bacterium]|nr:aspartate ammonia-lyase [Deltaproteobacteria bacterium]NIS76789.1 aspartate ammonia-lyase [Deltaproteobacteria bacterium]